MYIKSVIIDGFKSYGRRTEIHGFDPEFTAITGLNGTGKSNILDSICFVLGISNLGQVRATSLQDLVYKCGQAGVTKATVTLLFDNSDPSQCPLGYEKCRDISVTRQVVVGGKNKYMINGKNVQNKKIVDLFCSVQLNVNNPNFLIMQGRITKVLNMKPQEILSMIEEAAGTSMYESKRDATTKLIEKKDAKVRETNTLLKEEVEPKLEKLRRERAAYLEFQKICRDIEYLTRIHISSRYLKQKQSFEVAEKNLEDQTNHIESSKKKIIENLDEIEKLEQDAQEIRHKIDNESGGEMNELEKILSTKSNEEAQALGKLKGIQGDVEQEKKKLKALIKTIKDEQEALVQKESQMGKVQELFQSLKDAHEADTKAYTIAQKKYEAVTQGLSTNEDGEAASLQDQLMTAKHDVSEAETKIIQTDMELKHTRTILRQKESETQMNDAAYVKEKKKFDLIDAEIKNIMAELSKISYQSGCLESLEERRGLITKEIRNLKSQLDRNNAYKYELHYKDPEPDFDRSKVHGMVGKLFRVKDNANSIALKMCAGGNLYSYVTDNDITSKKILQGGQLQRRITIMPVNKMTHKSFKQSVIQTAESLVGRANVASALSLIDYDNYYNSVMRFIFGNTFICKDLNVAKQVTYHREIMSRSVTLEGDVVDPGGTLSGGSKPAGGDILKELEVIRKIEEMKKQKEEELYKIEQEIASMEDIARKFNSLKAKLDFRQHELNACQQQLGKTNFQQVQEGIRTLKTKIETLENDLVTEREKLQTAINKIKDIEDKLSDAKGYKERELKAASDIMKAAKKKSEQSQANWKKREQEHETLKLEIEELIKSIENSNKEVEKLTGSLETREKCIAEIKETTKDVSNEVAELKAKIKQQKDHINSQNRELKSCLTRKDKLEKQNVELKIDIKKKENEVTRLRNENKEAFARIDDLEKKYGWIKEDREFFGTKNTRYDYSKEDPVAAGRKLTKMKDQKDKMERNINLKAMVLLDREEEQYKEAMRRKLIVEEDKEKIREIICKMDEKKKEKVDSAWQVVDENFCSIFSTLLPGSEARLRPKYVNNNLFGLEIRVGFNGMWKESLGELSGGQRSLVALSLVLAMLKFCPAPLYILDEVDAALDMSHTQNIGNMLKAHFTNSQFIIVSLKDGMFNNANVLFRTKFEEGVSAVTRTVNVTQRKK